MCCYHYNYIKMNKITHVVYWATPHFHFGITLFYVADILGLKQYILHETDIENTFIVRKNWFSFHRYQINKKNINIIKKYLSKNNKSKNLKLSDLYGIKIFMEVNFSL